MDGRNPGASEAARGSILVANADPSTCELLAHALQQSGYDVALAEDAAQALRLVVAKPVDLVLLDTSLPDMSGLEALQAFRRSHSASELPVILATEHERSEDSLEAMRLGANDYVTKPFNLPVVLARAQLHLSLKDAVREIQDLGQQLELRNSFIRQTFGRYLSDEIVNQLLENPEALEIRGEERKLTILLADMRGFAFLTESLAPAEVMSILNNYLGTMSDVIQSYGGTVDKFIGDAVLAFFGAPVARNDDAERAVACAIAMQLAMQSVNQANRSLGLPEVEMGIGIATGDVVVGNIGSEKRAQYSAVGRPVNLAARLESYTLGREIFVSPATLADIEPQVHIDLEREIHPKGFDAPLRIYRVAGIEGSNELMLPVHAPPFVKIEPQLPVRFAILAGKQVLSDVHEGRIWALSSGAAKIRSEHKIAEMSDVRVEFLGERGDALAGAWYGKVIGAGWTGSDYSFIARFSARSTPLVELLERVLGSRAPS